MSFVNIQRVVREVFEWAPSFNPRDPEDIFRIIESLHEPLTAEGRIRLMTAHAVSFHDARGIYETATRPLTWDEYAFEDKVFLIALVAYHTHYRFTPPSVREVATNHYINYISNIIYGWTTYNHKVDPSRYNLAERCRSIRNFMTIMNFTTIRLTKTLYAYMANTAPLDDVMEFASRNRVIDEIVNHEAYISMMFKVEYRLASQTNMNPNNAVRIVRAVMDEMPGATYTTILNLHLDREK